MMTYSKADTTTLNEEARTLMKQDGMISKEEYLHTIHKEDEDDFGDKIVTKEEKPFAKGDRILFLGNDNGLGVSNGTLGVILEINRHKIKAKLDHTGDIVSFAPKLYPYFDQGWAANIHKSQGVTVDRAFLLATHETFRNLAYVGMTRHREWVKVFGSKLDFWREKTFFKRLSSSQEKLSSLDYVKGYDNINLPKQDSKLQEILNRLGNELEAIRFVSKQAWQSIAERFLGKLPEQQEIRIAQESMSEHIRAKEVLKAQNVENNKLYKKENQQGHAIRSASPPTSRTFEGEAHGIRVRPSTEKKNFKESLSPHEMVQEPLTLTSDNLKTQQQHSQTRPELTGFERIRSLIDAHKLARTEAERKQAKVILKQYAQELYKQDPTLKSIRDKDQEMTKQIRAILFEENRSKQIDKGYER